MFIEIAGTSGITTPADGDLFPADFSTLGEAGNGFCFTVENLEYRKKLGDCQNFLDLLCQAQEL